ncbi:hypothetical protein BDF14DRAFT_1003219 [Spinellus fusiger]|nr:hypothetical protein BDF14DRAFT_1003219 [Spinellus fusiger]
MALNLFQKEIFLILFLLFYYFAILLFCYFIILLFCYLIFLFFLFHLSLSSLIFYDLFCTFFTALKSINFLPIVFFYIMQRPFIVTAFTLFVFMIIVFILVSALGTRLYSDSYTENPQKHEKTAFVTVLCDISMTNAVLVSLFSLKNALADSSSDPSTDILVLVPHLTNISSSVDYFKALNVKLIETGEGYQSTDACKSTLDLWSMFDYKKIIYFSPNVLFREHTNCYNFLAIQQSLQMHTNQHTDLSL